MIRLTSIVKVQLIYELSYTMRSCHSLKRWECLALLVLLPIRAVPLQAAPSPATPTLPLQISNGGILNTTLLLPQFERPSDLPTDPFDIRIPNVPGQQQATLTTEIYGYGAELNIEAIYQSLRYISNDVNFYYSDRLDKPIGKPQLVCKQTYVTLVFHPEDGATWTQLVEALDGLMLYFDNRILDYMKGFGFQFLLIEDGGKDHLGLGIVEATPPTAVA